MARTFRRQNTRVTADKFIQRDPQSVRRALKRGAEKREVQQEIRQYVEA